MASDVGYRDACRRGGNTVKRRYGLVHYVEIGRSGGETTNERHGAELYPRLGRLVRDRYGPAHYARLSAMSAATLRYLPGLRLQRLRRGLSYAALSRRSGVARAAIRALEELERGARQATVEKLADAMGIAPQDLLGDPSRASTGGERRHPAGSRV